MYKRQTPVDCDPSWLANPAQSAPRREKKLSFGPISPKSVSSGGLLVGGRRGCSQQLQDQAVITYVDCDPTLPANPAQSAPKREKKLSFGPISPKSVSSGSLLVGGRRGCSQQLQDRAVITNFDFDPTLPANPALSAPRREKKLSFSPFATKAGMLWRSAGERSPRLEPAVARPRGHHSRRL